MKEEWRPVAGMGSAYEVSNMGRVRSLPRERRFYEWDFERRLRVIRQRMTGRVLILTAKRRPNGYLEVSLKWNGEQRMAYVHRLVLDAFAGPQPSAIHQSGHLNGVRDDNRFVNLAWVTPVVNAAHRKIHGTNRPSPERIANKRLAARLLVSSGMSIDVVAQCLSLSPENIRRFVQASQSSEPSTTVQIAAHSSVSHG